MTASSARRRPRWPGLVVAWLALLTLLGQLPLGATSTRDSLLLASAWLGTAAVLLPLPWKGPMAPPLLGWAPLALSYGLVILDAALSIVPGGLGHPNLVWRAVPGGAATISIDPYATLVEIVKLLALAAAFVCGSLVGADPERGRQLVKALLAVGAVYGAWAFIDHATNPEFLFGQPRPFDPRRLSASFGSANTAATLFGALSLLGLVNLIRAADRVRPRGVRLYAADLQVILPELVGPVVALAISMTCLVQTYSRGGLVSTGGVALALLCALALTGGRPSTAHPVKPLGVIFGLVTIVFAGTLILNAAALGFRFGAFASDTVGRTRIVAAHWAAIRDTPWWGYGMGAFPRINTLIMSSANVHVLDTLGATHNVYVQWLEEAGLLGTGAMLVTLGLVTANISLGVPPRTGWRGWQLGILAVLALFLVHGASDYALQIPSMSSLLSLLLGLGVGISSARPARGPPRV